LVSATEAANVVRVSFPVEVGESRQAEVVCFVKARPPLHLDVYYSHHIWRRRLTPTSKWEDENTMPIPITPQLEIQIALNVQNELWSMLLRGVRSLPEGIKSLKELP
jgi:hypothetical protein